MMFGGSFCQVLLGVLAKFRSPPIPLIAGDGPPRAVGGAIAQGKLPRIEGLWF
jgi:hypothetical protein